MPITRHVDNIHFDPGLPPGNPLLDENTHAFPTIFRLASQTFDFGSQAFGRRGRYFFEPQMMQYHGTALGAWNRLLSNLMPTDHMVELSSIETTLDQIATNTLHDAVTFREVNAAYREARIPSYNLLTEQQSAAVANMAHESINTAQALNMITRSARTPDFTAMAPSWSVGPEPQHAFELLLVGELKQRFDLLVMTLKIKGLLVGTLCQGLRYLAYSKRIYDTRFALIIHGHGFRRCFVTENDVLWIDIGRLGPDEENDVIDMTISDLLVCGLNPGANPAALYHELR